MKFYVYILESIEHNVCYIGQCNNVEERLELHNSPRARWTKRYQPWRLIHTEEYASRSEAMKREKYLKSLKNIRRFIEDIRAGKV